MRPRPRRAKLRAGGIVAIVLALAVNVAVVAATTWVGTHEQRVLDQLTVWQFEPTDELATYADRSTMTDEGRFLFYASRPEIEGEGDFDEICSSREEDVGILGCYLPDDKAIFLYDVTDDRLDGIEDVVAAHEMLHAAWDRMTDEERDALGPLLEAEAAKHAHDEAFAETLAFYAKAEPGERLNELHSIIGTEFGEIGDELEAHYALYFADRGALTALHEQSNAVFEQQAAAIEALVAQIDALAAAIDADYATYNAGYDQLNADIDSFNARAESGSFESIAQFNREREAMLQRQSDLDAFYTTIDAKVAEHNALIAQLDELNLQVDELNQSINIQPRGESDL
ncbi:MAG: hypothetical protein JWP85_931 [Rhodoglobus sp.]|nr:hypothetical protein [Rhodoglobus sp.]